MRRFSRRRAKRTAAITEVSLTPLIDTALTLLVIFMIASPMMHNAIKVTLPKGHVKEDHGLTTDIELYIDKEGGLFHEGTRYTLDTLVGVLQKKCARDTDKTVYVKADTATSYGTVVELVDHIKTVGGINHVALATQKHT